MASTEEMIEKAKGIANRAQSKLDSAMEENMSARVKAAWLKDKKGIKLSVKELDDLKDYKAKILVEKAKAGEDIGDAGWNFLNSYKQQRGPDFKNVRSIQNNLGLRFKEGFLDSKYGLPLVEKYLGKEFPGAVAKKIDNEIVFSLDGQNFHPLDPRSAGDIPGEIAEQVGRFGEPALAIATGFATKGVAAPASIAGGAQALREGIEASEGLNQQKWYEKGSDVAVKAGLDAAVGYGLSQIGKTGRALERKSSDLDSLRVEAGKVKEGQLNKSLEEKFKKGSGLGLATKIQEGLRAMADDFKGRYESIYKIGDALALSEGKAGQKLFTTDLDGRFGSLMDDFKLTDVNRDMVPGMFEKINKERAALGLGEYTPGQATSFDTKVAKEFIDKQFKKFPVGDKNRILLNEMRTTLMGARNDLAEQGSKSAQKLVEGDQVFKASRDAIPDDLREKVLEGAMEYGKRQKVTPSELFKRISAPPSASGSSSNVFLGEEELKHIKKILDLDPESTALDLYSGLSPKFTKTTISRPKEVPEEVTKFADALTSPSSLDEYQKGGGIINPNGFKKTLNVENTTGQLEPSYNAQSALSFFGKQVPEAGSSFDEIGNPTNIAALAGEGGKDILANLDELAKAQKYAQNQFLKEGADDVAAGPNTVITGAAQAATGNSGIGNMIGKAASYILGRPLGRTMNVTGRVLTPLGGAPTSTRSLAESLIGGSGDMQPLAEEELLEQLRRPDKTRTFTNR